MGPGTNFRVLMNTVSALFGMPDEETNSISWVRTAEKASSTHAGE